MKKKIEDIIQKHYESCLEEDNLDRPFIHLATEKEANLMIKELDRLIDLYSVICEIEKVFMYGENLWSSYRDMSHGHYFILGMFAGACDRMTILREYPANKKKKILRLVAIIIHLDRPLELIYYFLRDRQDKTIDLSMFKIVIVNKEKDDDSRGNDFNRSN